VPVWPGAAAVTYADVLAAVLARLDGTHDYERGVLLRQRQYPSFDLRAEDTMAAREGGSRRRRRVLVHRWCIAGGCVVVLARQRRRLAVPAGVDDFGRALFADMFQVYRVESAVYCVRVADER